METSLNRREPQDTGSSRAGNLKDRSLNRRGLQEASSGGNVFGITDLADASSSQPTPISSAGDTYAVTGRNFNWSTTTCLTRLDANWSSARDVLASVDNLSYFRPAHQVVVASALTPPVPQPDRRCPGKRVGPLDLRQQGAIRPGLLGRFR